MMTSADLTADLAAARRARARRWVGADTMHGYPALADEDETTETLAAEPPAKGGQRPKVQQAEK